MQVDKCSAGPTELRLFLIPDTLSSVGTTSGPKTTSGRAHGSAACNVKQSNTQTPSATSEGIESGILHNNLGLWLEFREAYNEYRTISVSQRMSPVTVVDKNGTSPVL